MANENNEVVFPYQVNTVMPITGLSIGNIMVPSTVKLTKEDVEICLRKAPIFRRFGNGKLVRVTLSAIDRLHNEDFMTEEEYENYLDKLGDNRGKVEVSISAPNEGGIVINKNPPSIYQEIKKEEPVVETIIEEADTTEDVQVDQTEEIIEETTVEDVNDEGISEEVTEESVSTDDQKKNEYNHNNRYNNKKKHNR